MGDPMAFGGATGLLSAVRKHEQLERREAAAQSGSRLAHVRGPLPLVGP